MARKIPHSRPIGFRIPVELRERLRKYQGDLPFARIMNAALTTWLDREEKIANFRATLEQGASKDA